MQRFEKLFHQEGPISLLLLTTETTGEFVLNDVVAYCSETTGEFVLNDVEWTNTPKMYKFTFLPHLVSYQEFHCTMV